MKKEFLKKGEKVYVAMSGGVDSSVAAALLVKGGYDVSGFMLKLWSCQTENACCPPEAVAHAYQVAGILGISFDLIDTREMFKKEIVDSFIAAYKNGLTPYPCYTCNQKIKWGEVFSKLASDGSGRIATGHYARIKKVNEHFQLYKALDNHKDQSYALSGLTQNQLARTIFPLGEYTKTQVREMARQFSLPIAGKKDSQDLCFIEEEGYRDFIRDVAPDSFVPGFIRSVTGEIIGKHDGLVNFTIGQRKGLGSGFPAPIYVIEKDVIRNEIIAGTKEQLGKNQFTASIQTWTPNLELYKPINCTVKTRYKAAFREVVAERCSKNEVVVRLKQLVPDLTPGQVAVFYNGDAVLGSAIIESTSLREF